MQSVSLFVCGVPCCACYCVWCGVCLVFGFLVHWYIVCLVCVVWYGSVWYCVCGGVYCCNVLYVGDGLSGKHRLGRNVWDVGGVFGFPISYGLGGEEEEDEWSQLVLVKIKMLFKSVIFFCDSTLGSAVCGGVDMFTAVVYYVYK